MSEGGKGGTGQFSLKVPLAKLGSRPLPFHLEADAVVRAGLVERFGLAGLDRLVADLEVSREGQGARVSGRFEADVAQTCIVSGEPVAAHVAEAIALQFQPDIAAPGQEIELEEEALDVLPLEGESVDLAEAVAQSLLLALDPYPRASEEVLARARRHLLSEEEAAELEAQAKAATNPFSKLRSK
ncbi:DUF177 domain-containing protein [Sandaracinobacter sp. RS1-74]|uniref:YceD family protein n=1 Tax=Sandaracinobacteroides sayramensis TaxID=2913411 RepID=UPI001ED9EC86|nr:DUF177 domain-containing protein [Sandaracinobacteroides sayramensis]MCG2842559.1 DUF177 domain-containing protein [Sandaracinobacteroides sayramensis]